ncbi:glutathione S-transferase 1-like [Bradysia coprophila]|uniref:glutathione S-transferase 1-like n=1 Tax=Bradysia coprophila TaxID=38358 RepID=UPI00187D8EE3|nr:glutathione S-transferase 1-like [Bradysia coprophila]
MGKIVFYYTLLSPPSRAVLLTGKALGIEFDLRNVDLIKGEHLSEEFKKLNPQHTIPLIIDNGVIIYDSHAICAYLCDKYANTDQLYPKDLVKRAEVDARLHFDTGFLFARLRFLYEPILYCGSAEVPEDKVQYIEKCWPIMEAFLERGPYLCGNELTIADYCCVATVSSLRHYGGDMDKYPKLSGWLKRMRELPDYESLCGEGGDLLVKTVDQMVEKNRLS